MTIAWEIFFYLSRNPIKESPRPQPRPQPQPHLAISPQPFFRQSIALLNHIGLKLKTDRQGNAEIFKYTNTSSSKIPYQLLILYSQGRNSVRLKKSFPSFFLPFKPSDTISNALIIKMQGSDGFLSVALPNPPYSILHSLNSR